MAKNEHDGRPAPLYPPIRRGEPLSLWSSPGIGDVCWLAAAIGNAREALDLPELHVTLPTLHDEKNGRAMAFADRFTFIDSVGSEAFDIFERPFIEHHRVKYRRQGYSGNRYYLMLNPHLEWVGRLEEAFPDIPPCWDALSKHYAIHKPDYITATSMCRRGRFNERRMFGYIVLHLGSLYENCVAGMNTGSLWTPGDWRTLVRMLREQTTLPMYVIGAHYDRSYHSLVLAGMEDAGITDLAGKLSVPLAIEVLRAASLCVGFPSGMSMAAVYMDVPTVMFWRREGHPHDPLIPYWFSDSFATNWVPPHALSRYYPARYTLDTPQSVVEACGRLLE